MRRPITGLKLSALLGVGLLGGCVFDLDPYQVDSGSTAATGGGGAPSATVGPTPSTTTSSSATGSSASTGEVTSSSGDTSASSGDASASSGASSSSGGPVALAPCGGFTDDFQQFTSPPWIKHDASHVGPTNKKYVQTEIGFDVYANARLAGAEYHDCYASIELVGQSGGSAGLRLYQGLFNQTAISVDMDQDLSFPGGGFHVGGFVRALGIAFVDDKVYYLYVAPDTDVWQPVVAVQDRPDWMSDGNDDQLGFGVNGVIDDSASFDSFNMRPITHLDLGLSP